MNRFSVRMLMTAVLCLPAFAGCGATRDDTFCSESVSVSGFVVDLSFGLDNRSEFTYVQFRTDTEDVLDVVSGIATAGTSDDPVDETTRDAASKLSERIGAFVAAMRLVGWDLSRAASRPEISEAWSQLVTPESLADANLVEALIIGRCGLPSRVTAVGDGPDRLPDPSIPSPTATDPPTAPIDEASEHRALGELVAALFGAQVDQRTAVCLGRELSDVVDTSTAESDMALYLRQFQGAFDYCGVDVVVPTG